MDWAEKTEGDQVIAWMRDFIPPYLWSMFSAYREQGFSVDQAFSLVQCHLIAAIMPKKLDA